MKQTKDSTKSGYVGPTSTFVPDETIYDDGEFMVSNGKWFEDKSFPGEQTIAMRWYTEGIGYPNGFGRAQWMLVPDFVGKAIHLAVLQRTIIKTM
jgi:hypothetical protein